MGISLQNNSTASISSSIESSLNKASKYSKGLSTNQNTLSSPIDSLISHTLRDKVSMLSSTKQNTYYMSNLLSSAEGVLDDIRKVGTNVMAVIQSAENASNNNIDALQENINISMKYINDTLQNSNFDGRTLFAGGSSDMEMRTGIGVLEKLAINLPKISEGQLTRSSLVNQINTFMKNQGLDVGNAYYTANRATMSTALQNNHNFLYKSLSAAANSMTEAELATLLTNVATIGARNQVDSLGDSSAVLMAELRYGQAYWGDIMDANANLGVFHNNRGGAAAAGALDGAAQQGVRQNIKSTIIHGIKDGNSINEIGNKIHANVQALVGVTVAMADQIKADFLGQDVNTMKKLSEYTQAEISTALTHSVADTVTIGTHENIRQDLIARFADNRELSISNISSIEDSTETMKSFLENVSEYKASINQKQELVSKVTDSLKNNIDIATQSAEIYDSADYVTYAQEMSSEISKAQAGISTIASLNRALQKAREIIVGNL
jgi:hypothetical protein